ncbi:MAG: hypothetical protein ABSB01_27660, partial [Streptosporangiaceae bacterium]
RRAGSVFAQRVVYVGTNSFLVTFSQLLAAEVRDSGNQVQVVCPWRGALGVPLPAVSIPAFPNAQSAVFGREASEAA